MKRTGHKKICAMILIGMLVGVAFFSMLSTEESLGSQSIRGIETIGDTRASTQNGWGTEAYDYARTSFYPIASTIITTQGFTKLWGVSEKVSGAVTGDVNNDGKLELIYTVGSSLFCVNGTGTQLWTKSITGDANTQSVKLITDITGDSIPEIFVSNKVGLSLQALVYDGQGNLLKTFTRSGGSDSAPIFPTAVITVDGAKKMIGALGTSYAKYPRGASCFDYTTGDEDWHYKVGPWPNIDSFAVDDINGDGKMEIVIGGGQVNNGATGNGLGGNTTTTDAKVYTVVCNEYGNEIFTKEISDGARTIHSVVDLNRDNKKEILVLDSHDATYYTGISNIHLLNTQGVVQYSFAGPNSREWTSWAVGDINKDGYDEVVVGSQDGTVRILNKTLNQITSASIATTPLYGRTGMAINDINGDGNQEIIAIDNTNHKLHVLKNDLTELWSYQYSGDMDGLMLSDINEDGINEIILWGDELLILGYSSGEEATTDGLKLTEGLNIDSERMSNDIDINDHTASFSWSHDSSKIAFSADDGSGFNELFVYDMDTKSATKLTNSGMDHFPSSWHPDDSWLTFGRRDQAPAGGSNGINIYKMRSNGDESSLLQLTSGKCEGDSVFSPNADNIAFISCQDNVNGWYHLWTMDLDGENEELVGNHGVGGNPVFSPDGEYIAYDQRSYWNKPSNIYAIRSNGTEDALVHSSILGSAITYDWSTITWSSDGEKLLFTDGSGNTREIYSINRDGTDLSRLTNNNVEDFFKTAGNGQIWNSVRDQIVYVSYESGSSEIWMMNSDGSEKEQLTSDGLQKTSPLWSPDGTNIAYIAENGGKWELYNVSMVTTITETINNETCAYWPFDEGTGQHVYDTSGNDHDGTLGLTSSIEVNDPTWTSSGISGNALEFDGVDDYVNAGYLPGLNETFNLTIEAWINTDVVDVHRAIIANLGSYGSAGGIQLSLTGSPAYIEVSFRNEDHSTNYNLHSTSIIIPGTWYLVTGTYYWDGAGTTLSVYVNGQLENSVFYSGKKINYDSVTPLYIGSNIDGAPPEGMAVTREFNGIIDEASIYNYALSAEEITSHYESFIIEIDTDFDPLDDGFSFENSHHTFSDTMCNYLIPSAIEQKLNSDPMWAAIFATNPQIKPLVYDIAYLASREIHKNGHCYGMSSLAINYFNNPQELPANEKASNLLLSDNDATGESVYSRVCYLQQSELLDIYSMATWFLMELSGYSHINFISNANEISQIKTMVQEGPVRVGLWGGLLTLHVVVAYAVEGNQLLVYDPNYQTSVKSIDISNPTSFTYTSGDYTFTRLCSLESSDETVVNTFIQILKNLFWVRADCPVNLQVIDKNGTNVGISMSDGETHLVVVPNPSNDSYKINVTGTGEGDYILTVARTSSNQVYYQNSTGSIKSGEVVNYELTVSSNGIALSSTSEGIPLVYYILTGLIIAVVVILVLVLVMRKKKSTPISPLPQQQSYPQTYQQNPPPQQYPPQQPPSTPPPPPP